MYRDMLKQPEVSLGNDCKFTHTQTSHGCKHTLCIILQFFIGPRVTKLRVCISTHRHGYKEHTYMLSFMLESVCCMARGHSSVLPFLNLCFLLPQLVQLRGTDKKFTLLHALVEQIMLHEPCLATFPQELAEFETIPGGICQTRFDQT